MQERPSRMSAAERRRAIRRRRLAAGGIAAGVVVLLVALIVLLTHGGGGGGSAAPPGGGSSGPAPCRVPRVSGATVDVFRTAAGGACVPTAKLVAMRCAAGDAPLLAADGRRYLGGAYAVPLPRLPKGARSLGVGSDGQVWWSPKSGLMVVEKDGRFWRWLTLPAKPQAAGKPSVHFLGDSVMLGAHSAIERAFGHWDLTFDARESRSTTDALPIVQRWRSAIRDAIVIQLGTNDGGIPSYYRIHVDNILNSLRGVPLVVWLTMAHARAYYAVDDRVIRSELSTHPNTVLGDWNAALPDGGAYRDGLHLTPTGATAMARLARRILGPWRMARVGAGPAACADAVVGSA